MSKKDEPATSITTSPEFKILGYENIPVENLTMSPDALAYKSDPDDRAAIRASVDAARTVFQPLTVQKEPDGKHMILDGCGRFIAVDRHNHECGPDKKISSLPCVVVECGDPRAYVLTVNAMGRKRSTGSRILAFVLANQEMVMRARESVMQSEDMGASGHVTAGRRNRAEIPQELIPWTASGIAKSLAVSAKDVSATIELILCRENGQKPDRWSGKTRYVPLSGDKDEEAMDRAFSGVMCGRVPVRRWASALAGMSSTAGRAKAETDYGAVFLRAVISMSNVFENWEKVPFEARKTALDKFEAALSRVPKDVLTTIQKVIPPPDAPKAKAKK